MREGAGARRASRPTALITGGGKGIGRHIALTLAASHRVAIAGRDREALQAVVHEIRDQGGDADSFACDVTVPDQVSEVVQALESEGGAVDVAVCNAGIAGPVASCEDVKLDDWGITIAVNLTGPFLVCRAVIPGMKRARAGVIVLVGSTTGKRAVPTRTPYATTKMGLIGFGRALAAEVGPFGICVNTICPGVVEGDRWNRVVGAFARDEQVPVSVIEDRYRRETVLRRFVPPTAVSAMVDYLVSPAGRVITGQDINVCAGLLMD